MMESHAVVVTYSMFHNIRFQIQHIWIESLSVSFRQFD